MKMTPDSLSKFLAQAGIDSRRKVVEIIRAGLVKVNGIVIREPATVICPQDVVTYKERVVKGQAKIYLMLNKPRNYVTTLADEKGRRTVMDLLDTISVRVYPVGRLDRDTTGLLIITNDGELAQSLAHPRFEVQKTYVVTVNRPFAKTDMDRLKEGVSLYDGFIKVDSAYYAVGQGRSQVVVTLHSGKNRIVRRIFEHLGYKVERLDRSAYAGLTKKGLPIGRWRLLAPEEVEALHALKKRSGAQKKSRKKLKDAEKTGQRKPKNKRK